MEIIGFIGLGTMGKPMAGRLFAGGYEVLVVESSSSSRMMREQGAEIVPSYRDQAARADTIIVCVPNSSIVEDIVYNSGRLLDAMGPGKLLIDMGTSDPSSTRRIAADLESRGADMLDAPVSGGEKGAMEGTLSCMVGGRKEVFEGAQPLLANLAATVRYIGSSGMGHTMKLLNNVVVVNTIVSLCEVFAIAERQGMDLGVVLEVLAGGSASSKALDFWGQRMVGKDYEDPTYRYDLAAKDMRLAHELVIGTGLSYPLFSGTHQVFTIANALGLETEDVSKIKSMWDTLNSELRH